MTPRRKDIDRRRITLTALAVCAAALAVLSIATGARTGEGETAKTSLVVIDVQRFYFPGGFLPLENPEAASGNCKRLIQKFRTEGGMIVHVGHNASKDKAFHPDVAPADGEKVFFKDDVNPFHGTDLLSYLRENGVERLVVCGMMTHMCVEAAVRAAHDLGFECVLVGDACATRDLQYDDQTVPAADVHRSTLATLDRSYATVVDTETFLSN